MTSTYRWLYLLCTNELCFLGRGMLCCGRVFHWWLVWDACCQGHKLYSTSGRIIFSISFMEICHSSQFLSWMPRCRSFFWLMLSNLSSLSKLDTWLCLMNNYIVRSYRDLIVITKFAITKYAIRRASHWRIYIDSASVNIILVPQFCNFWTWFRWNTIRLSKTHHNNQTMIKTIELYNILEVFIVQYDYTHFSTPSLLEILFAICPIWLLQ